MVESRALEGRASLLNGQARECLAITFGPHAALRAACLHAAGQPDSAAALADSVARAVTTGQSQDENYTDVLRADGLATYYAWVGDVERAMQWLEWAFDRSPLAVERRVLQSALFGPVRADPDAGRRLDQLIRGVWDRVLQQEAVVR